MAPVVQSCALLRLVLDTFLDKRLVDDRAAQQRPSTGSAGKFMIVLDTTIVNMGRPSVRLAVDLLHQSR